MQKLQQEAIRRAREMQSKAKNNVENTEKKVNKKNRERGEIFIKIMAGVLALLMLVGTSASFIYALMNI